MSEQAGVGLVGDGDGRAVLTNKGRSWNGGGTGGEKGIVASRLEEEEEEEERKEARSAAEYS